MNSTVECTKIIYKFLTGKSSQNWISTSMLHAWHQDVSELYVATQISQIAQALLFGIMVNESTRGETKNLVICYQAWNRQTQTPVVTMEDLDVMKCTLWTTDNTAYMSSDKNITQDPIPRIVQNGKLARLPNGRRAREMLDKIQEWKDYLKNIKDNFEMFFADELLEAIDILPSNEFEQMFNNLEHGISKAYEFFEKWMEQWLHLPLVICRLGGDRAHSFRFVVFKKNWIKSPSELELEYANELKKDIDNGKTNDYDLHKLLLHDIEFYEEFENFCQADNLELHKFPKLYDFVQTNIYFIVIHQQQESKLRLASDKIGHEDLKLGLEKIRAQ
ncbi:9226_t:CDS:2 [Gigaspora margarita]|uniref:9226_t:CDS:1 n=1 Tax=Gigaspora margarita TaxID=4874 RepID=A0ABM8W1S6_GIGMA|nr:9226_t:CDS:2 [Gigaspora margarita]